MKFKWKKLGILFDPSSRSEWMNTHAQVPYSVLFDDYVRVYFSTRERADSNNYFKSYSGFVDLDRKNLNKIIQVSKNPILALGKLGEFDEFGCMAGSVVKDENKYLLYYCGWQRSVSVPYAWSIGLAESFDAISFKKIGCGPLIGPIINEPYLQACPIVYKFSQNNWHMFYLSGLDWINDEHGKLESKYQLMHATSCDGINWKRDGLPILQPLVENECQTSASILMIGGTYHMFFSYRHGTDFRREKSKGYRIGYASSTDLLEWNRDDSNAGINVGDDGWDSQMIAYPHLQEIAGNIYMFYCGNDFGKNGFGYAILEN